MSFEEIGSSFEFVSPQSFEITYFEKANLSGGPRDAVGRGGEEAAHAGEGPGAGEQIRSCGLAD